MSLEIAQFYIALRLRYINHLIFEINESLVPEQPRSLNVETFVRFSPELSVGNNERKHSCIWMNEWLLLASLQSWCFVHWKISAAWQVEAWRIRSDELRKLSIVLWQMSRKWNHSCLVFGHFVLFHLQAFLESSELSVLQNQNRSNSIKGSKDIWSTVRLSDIYTHSYQFYHNYVDFKTVLHPLTKWKTR